MIQQFYKVIYQPEVNRFLRMINKALSPVLPKKLRLPPSGILTIKLHSGKWVKIMTNQTNYLTQLVYWNGYENFEYTRIFEKLVSNIAVFYDIGANIGYYSLIAAVENESIKVVGFEPATGPLYYFIGNVQLNELTNVTVAPLALSDKEGEITFYEIKKRKYTSLEHNLGGEGNTGSITTGRNFVSNLVKTMTLDQYVADNEPGKIDLIKIDTEGTEHLILGKADHVLSSMKPIVICETLFDTIELELETLFRKYGYEFYNHIGDYLVKVDTILRKEDNGVRNCFFVHPEKLALISEFVKPV